MNLPNKLTVGRLGITAAFVIAMSIREYWGDVTALVLFIAASITDYYDGKIARERNLITDFGKLMDPLADKILVAAAFILLCERDLIPAWIVIVIITREFLVTGIRLIASANGSVLAADNLGKLKTILQITASIYLLLYLSIPNDPIIQLDIQRPAEGIGLALAALAGILTIWSGLSYAHKNRHVIIGSSQNST